MKSEQWIKEELAKIETELEKLSHERKYRQKHMDITDSFFFVGEVAFGAHCQLANILHTILEDGKAKEGLRE